MGDVRIEFWMSVHMLALCIFFFFFQAEDGIRDYKVTGVQTCALPIWRADDRPGPLQSPGGRLRRGDGRGGGGVARLPALAAAGSGGAAPRLGAGEIGRAHV